MSSTFGREPNASTNDVNTFHNNDDVDKSAKAHHHTLGIGPGQAAPGPDFKALKDLVVSIQEGLAGLVTYRYEWRGIRLARRTTNQIMSTASVVSPVGYTTADFNDEDFYEYNTPAGEIIVPEDGWYFIRGKVTFNPSLSTGATHLKIGVNGSEMIRGERQANVTIGDLDVSGWLPLTAGDELTVILQHPNSTTVVYHETADLTTFTVLHQVEIEVPYAS